MVLKQGWGRFGIPMPNNVNGFPPILGLFYTVFHPTQGSKVVCQVPDGVVITTATSEVPEPLIDFDVLKNYLIPKPSLCNRQVGIRYNDKYVVGYPVNLVGQDYERNSFTFNFVAIFPDNNDVGPYELALKRLAKMFTALEEQSRYLSNPENIYSIDSILEQMYQDLNNFSECQIPIDHANKVNIKLFPIFEAPPDIHAFNVPVPTVRLAGLIDEMWDPTMERIIPYINGINSVRRIADLAEANYSLTLQCIQHLIHYDCVIIIGILQFSNIYCPTPNVVSIATDAEMYRELCAFVYNQTVGTHSNLTQSGVTGSSNSRGYSSGNSSNTPASHSSFDVPQGTKLSPVQVFKLYAALQNGQSLYTWYNEHRDLLQDIDVRRFITFGIVKELCHRVYAYPVLEPRYHTGKMHRSYHTPSDPIITRALTSAGIAESPLAVSIVRHCFEVPVHFDSLSTDLRAPRAKVNKLLRSLGEFAIINR